MADDTHIHRTFPVDSTHGSSSVGGFGLHASHAYISWRSILAGFLVSILTFAILMTLGMGIGGFALSNVIEGPGGPGGGFSLSAAIWTAVSMILALFSGSYFAGRVSSFPTSRVGAAQGLVIASLFFVLFFWQVFSAIGWAGRTTVGAIGGAAQVAGSAAGGAASRLDDLARTAPVQDALDQVFDKLNVSDPAAVGQGVLSRLLAGNFDSAVNYLSRQTGISPADARSRLESARGNIQGAAEQAGVQVARAVSGAGWSLFVLTLLGTLAGSFGGGLGSRENRRHPIELEAAEGIRAHQPAGV